MKNLIISLLTTKIIMGMSFWNFADADDRIVIAVAMVIVLWASIEGIDEIVSKIRRARRMKKRRADRFKLEVIDLTQRRA